MTDCDFVAKTILNKIIRLILFSRLRNLYLAHPPRPAMWKNSHLFQGSKGQIGIFLAMDRIVGSCEHFSHSNTNQQTPMVIDFRDGNRRLRLYHHHIALPDPRHLPMSKRLLSSPPDIGRQERHLPLCRSLAARWDATLVLCSRRVVAPSAPVASIMVNPRLAPHRPLYGFKKGLYSHLKEGVQV